MVIAFDPISVERVRQMISEYDEARLVDGHVLRECFNHPKVAALVINVC